MATEPAVSPNKTEAFLGKVLTDTSGTVVTVLASIGDRLGLFTLLAQEPATSSQFAARAHIDERYAREWLSAMTSAGYVDFDPTSMRFTLPAEHAPILAQEHSPIFFGGMHQMLMGMIAQQNALLEVFKQGGGIPQSAYDNNMWDGMERFTAGWFENFLVPVWIPAMPAVQAKLEQGAVVADVGCGRGRALIKLAQTYPNSHFVGYDSFAPTIAQAAAHAQAAGVADQIRFEVHDVAEGLPETYDIITTFDVIHDAVNPRGLLQSIRKALRPDGRYICLEFNVSDKLQENIGPLYSLFYGASMLYCMTTSLAHHGEGLGTLGLPESKVRELGTEAGFSNIRHVPLENPFNILYELSR